MTEARLTDDSPGTIGLAAGPAAGFLGAALNEDGLAEVGAAEAVRVIVIVGDAKLAVVLVLCVLPVIGRVRPSGVEAVVVGLVGVAAVLAVHIFGQRRAKCAADNHASNGRPGAPAAIANRISE